MLNVGEMLCGRILRVFHVHRFSGSPVHRKESVGEHLWLAALYSDLISQELEARLPEIEIDTGKLLRRAIYHDVEESITGDIVRGVKYGGDGAVASIMGRIGAEVVQG